MVIDVFNKVLVFLLCLSILNVLRHTFFLITNVVRRQRFVMEKNSLLFCLLYTSPSPRDRTRSRMPSSA